jgi:hypothetical protein
MTPTSSTIYVPIVFDRTSYYDSALCRRHFGDYNVNGLVNAHIRPIFAYIQVLIPPTLYRL